jgi:hypothetical protein
MPSGSDPVASKLTTVRRSKSTAATASALMTETKISLSGANSAGQDDEPIDPYIGKDVRPKPE